MAKNRLKLSKKSGIILLLIIAVCLCGVAVGKYMFDRYRNNEDFFHGPRASSLSTLRTSQYGQVDASGPSFITRSNPENSNPTATPETAQVPTVAALPITAPQKPSSGLGIAAGGDLLFYSQSQLDQYFSLLQALGVKWVRWDLDWGVVQAGGQSSYDWSGADRVVNTAAARGMSSLPIITYTPAWARSSACKSDDKCVPSNQQLFADFAGKASARYTAKGVHTWEIWNEPNSAAFWKPAPNIASYTSLLKLSYAAIKASDGQSTVITGGLAAAANENGDIAPITFVQGLYTNGGQVYFDAVGLHPYSFPVVASYAEAWNSWQQMQVIRQLMVNKGDSAKKIWVTEYGAPTNGPGVARTTSDLTFNYPDDYMSEAAQNAIAADIVSQYQANKTWLGPFFWYSLKDLSTNKNSTENFFGLLRADSSQKPAYDTIKNGLK